MEVPFYHEPVMLREVMDWLIVEKTGVYVDATVGGAGHSYAILKNTDAFLIGMDWDAEAIHFAERRLAEFGSRKVLVKENFANLGSVLKSLNIEKVNGILLDLGVSSHQLDTAERGFSFHQEAPLDMRMDQEAPLSAFEIVNGFSEQELERIIRFYGEEKMAAKIARAISQKRGLSPIRTTVELAAIVQSCLASRSKRHGRRIHPATRTFQAIRIAVNHELDNIPPAIRSAADALKSGGRLCVISFHSLEDRVVKNAFRTLAGKCTCPREMPVCVCFREEKLQTVTRKVVVPSAEEIALNPRARSAKLRVARRI